ncbi:MAG: B12-binding domain-containing radical SAM protein [Bacillota bacterium]
MGSVLLINSPIFGDKVEKFNEDSLPPIGLGYIATALEQSGINVELIDAYANNLIPSEIGELISQKKPGYVCLNIFTSNFEVVRLIVEITCVDVHFIIGGQVAKHVYKEIMNWETENNIDIVVGEGDFIVRDIIMGTLKEKPLVETEKRRVFNVDKNSQYFPENISSIPLKRSYFEYEPQKNYYGQIEANIITSRGCIYDCAFCGAARSLNRHIKVRERDAQSIIDEIKCLKSIYPELNAIRILDDLFLKNIDSIKKAIKIFTNFDLNWRCMAHVKSFKNVPLYLLNKMKASGCRELFIGIESGSVRILRMINKTSNLEMIISTIIRVFKAGINVKAYFILGFPGENEDDIVASYNLAIQIKKYAVECGVGFRVSAFQFRPYHGTKLYGSILHKNGAIGAFLPNRDLTKQVGRTQFNLCSGNYSDCNDLLLHRYINLMMNLN